MEKKSLKEFGSFTYTLSLYPRFGEYGDEDEWILHTKLDTSQLKEQVVRIIEQQCIFISVTLR